MFSSQCVLVQSLPLSLPFVISSHDFHPVSVFGSSCVLSGMCWKNAAFCCTLLIVHLFVSQATDRPMGMNGLDVAGLRPFDLVIPFTIQKGEITGNLKYLMKPAVCHLHIRSDEEHSRHLLKVRSECLRVRWPNPTLLTTKTAPSPSSMRLRRPACMRWTSNTMASTFQVPQRQFVEDGRNRGGIPTAVILIFTGSPLQFYVDYMNSGNVSAYGPGLIHGTVNKPAVFTVDTKDAGEGMEFFLLCSFDCIFLKQDKLVAEPHPSEHESAKRIKQI